MQQPPYGNGMPMPYGAQQPIMAVRKNIPDSTGRFILNSFSIRKLLMTSAFLDGSAFSFMGDASTGPSSNDSFSFVSDAMNTFKK